MKLDTTGAMKRLIAVAALLAGGGAALLALHSRPDQSCLAQPGRMAGALPIPRGVTVDCAVARKTWEKAGSPPISFIKGFHGPQGDAGLRLAGDLTAALKDRDWVVTRRTPRGPDLSALRLEREGRGLLINIYVPADQPSEFVIAAD